MTPFLKLFHGSLPYVGINKASGTHTLNSVAGLHGRAPRPSPHSRSHTGLPLVLNTPCSLLLFSSCAVPTAWDARSGALGWLAPVQPIGLSLSCAFPGDTPHIASRHDALSEDICDASVQTCPVCGHVSALVYLVFSPYQDGRAGILTRAEHPTRTLAQRDCPPVIH